jgi:signal transduction histidine kinase
MIEKGSDSEILEAAGTAAVRWPNARLKSEAFQNAILRSAKLAAMATDAAGIIQLFNLGAELLLGYTAAEVVDRVAVVDLHDQHELTVRARLASLELSTAIAPNFQAMICKVPWGGEDCYQSLLIHKSKRRVPVAISITALRDDMGTVLGYTVFATDVSEKTDLLTLMSHEMRTPLSAILGFAQLMDSGHPSPPVLQKTRIDRILQAGWYLEKLINMTLDLDLIESGALAMSLEAVALPAVMLDCQSMIQSQAQIRGVRVTFPVLDAQWSVSADRIRLQEVLCSLVCAAIENSDVNGAVNVSCESVPDWIRIRITSGSEAYSVARPNFACQPYGEQEQRATPVDGAGLGLLLAKRLVELMGGAIGGNRIENRENLFFFDLRRVLPTAASGAASHLVVREADIPNGLRSRSPFHSPDQHFQQRS